MVPRQKGRQCADANMKYEFCPIYNNCTTFCRGVNVMVVAEFTCKRTRTLNSEREKRVAQTKRLACPIYGFSSTTGSRRTHDVEYMKNSTLVLCELLILRKQTASEKSKHE